MAAPVEVQVADAVAVEVCVSAAVGVAVSVMEGVRVGVDVCASCQYCITIPLMIGQPEPASSKSMSSRPSQTVVDQLVEHER